MSIDGERPDEEIDYGTYEGTAYGGSDSDVPILLPNASVGENNKNHPHRSDSRYEPSAIERIGAAASSVRSLLFSNAGAWSAFASVVVAVATIVYTVYAHRQWAAMSDQITQMRRANELTQMALNGSEDTLNKTLEKLQGQIQATTNLYTEAQKQTKQATVQAANSGVQAAATQSAAKTARAAVDVAQQQLDISERPWVEAQIELTPLPGQKSAVWIDNQNGWLFVGMTIDTKNVGKSPAIKILTDVVALPNVPDDAQALQVELCEKARDSNSPNFGATVFPNDTTHQFRRSWLTKEIRESELIRPSNHNFKSAKGDNILIAGMDDQDFASFSVAMQQQGFIPAPSIFLMGCIDYSVDYNQSHHQTMFLYRLVGIDFRTGDASNLQFSRVEEVGNSAN